MMLQHNAAVVLAQRVFTQPMLTPRKLVTHKLVTQCRSTVDEDTTSPRAWLSLYAARGDADAPAATHEVRAKNRFSHGRQRSQSNLSTTL